MEEPAVLRDGLSVLQPPHFGLGLAPGAARDGVVALLVLLDGLGAEGDGDGGGLWKWNGWVSECGEIYCNCDEKITRTLRNKYK